MENASKALIMAAEVLIGVVVISIGVVLFSMFQNYSRDTIDQMNQSKVTEFNNNFSKYVGTVSTFDSVKKKEVNIPINVSAHDVITAANFARENNSYYGLKYDEVKSFYESTLYVKVDIDTRFPSKTYSNLENWSEDSNEKTKFIDNNSVIFFNCTDGGNRPYTRCFKLEEVNRKYSPTTGRICYVKFTEYTKEEYQLLYDIEIFDIL